jgi:hypothetical protein
MKAAALLAVVALAAGAGCGAGRPKDDPSAFALRILDLIVHNHYSQAWDDLHPVDQKVAPFGEYVGCEARSPVIASPRTVKVLRVNDESVGLGDGTFVKSKAVDVRLGFRGGFHVVHTVHVVANGGKWKWILPSWRFRDYRADRCPTDPGSSPPPQQS